MRSQTKIDAPRGEERRGATMWWLVYPGGSCHQTREMSRAPVSIHRELKQESHVERAGGVHEGDGEKLRSAVARRARQTHQPRLLEELKEEVDGLNPAAHWCPSQPASLPCARRQPGKAIYLGNLGWCRPGPCRPRAHQPDYIPSSAVKYRAWGHARVNRLA